MVVFIMDISKQFYEFRELKNFPGKSKAAKGGLPEGG